MGLAITIGALAEMIQHDEEGADWVRGQLQTVNGLVAKQGIATFVEPESVELNNRCSLSGYPYSWIHYLRRAYAYHVNDRPVGPVLGADNPTDDGLVMDETMMMSSHLLCHSDAEGYYVPVDFDEVIFSDDVPGSMLGSSYRLKAELATVAPALGITLIDGALTDDEAARLNATEPDAHNEREIWTWFSHWEAARLSIEHSCTIMYN